LRHARDMGGVAAAWLGGRLIVCFSPQRPAFCPRCGYDLSGTIAAWECSCPVDGVCGECGLGFRWAGLFRVREPEGHGNWPGWLWAFAQALRSF
jgi:hypothetical protein